MKSLLRDARLHTVCESARCPNIGECFRHGTAAFLILGDVCTRGCSFCAVRKGTPLSPDEGEPERVALAAARLRLSHVVVTGVTRDDLPDGGAGYFARTTRALDESLPESTKEVLVPDFMGSEPALKTVIEASPDIFNHNVETVPRLYPQVRPRADWNRSISIIRLASEAGILTKSGMMLGMGETRDEVERAMGCLLDAGCRILTLGQYLAPSRNHRPVSEYLAPETFVRYGELGEKMGFYKVFSAPLVRSSYRAHEILPVSQRV